MQSSCSDTEAVLHLFCVGDDYFHDNSYGTAADDIDIFTIDSIVISIDSIMIHDVTNIQIRRSL